MQVLLGIDGVGEHNEFAFFFFKVLYYTILYKKISKRYVGGFRKRTRILPKIIETAFYLTYRELCINISSTVYIKSISHLVIETLEGKEHHIFFSL